MNRKQADVAAGILIASILSIGVLTAVQLLLGDDAMMGRMDSAPAMRLVGPVLGSLVVASIVGGVYVFVRNQVFTTDAGDATRTESSTEPDDTAEADDVIDQATPGIADAQPPDPATRRQLLDVLPEDERRILEPVVESPGLTQIRVRDRSGFSKSKVSQTITGLEERGLLYREPQGRTYRVYPADDLEDRV